jgi:endonuclease/exonuclease/phosphatase family metal-dependent hydrolase
MKATITLLFSIVLFCHTSCAQEPEDSSKFIKVLSFNILHGSTTKEDFNLDVLANVIKEADPDFVAMQEVDFKANRSKKYDLVTELGWRTQLAPLFGRAMPFDGGEYGEGILSRFTFIQSRAVPLPYMPGEEPRTALEIVVALPSQDTIAFVGTHFAHEGNDGRVLQANEVNRVFSQNKYPTILAGDLNAIPGSDPINILEQLWTSTYDKESPAYTYSSDDPRIKIDYVMFYPKNRWEVVDREVIQDTIASDHCAYLVTLKLLDE